MSHERSRRLHLQTSKKSIVEPSKKRLACCMPHVQLQNLFHVMSSGISYQLTADVM